LCDAVCGTSATLSSTLTRPKGRPTRGAFSSSSRLASVSDLLPPPAAFAARARRQPSSRRRHFAAAPASPPRSSPPRDSQPICCRSGHSPASLVACRSDASWHFHSAPPSARKDLPCARHLVACAPARTVEFRAGSPAPARNPSAQPAAADDVSSAAQQQQPSPRHQQPARARQVRRTKNFPI
jgi:hypothetical protein